MLQSADYARNLCTKKNNNIYSYVKSPLSYLDAVTLENYQKEDAINLAQVSTASLIEAISGVFNNRFSWSKVKFFYSAFYAVQAMLLLRNISIFYIEKTPYSLESHPTFFGVKESGNSHSVAFEKFKHIFNGDYTLSQDIDGRHPIEWIESIRNEISYRTAPFPDPNVPAEFSAPKKNIALHIESYIKDKDYLYAFQPDHATIAYPVLLNRRVSDLLLHSIAEVKNLNENHRNILNQHYNLNEHYKKISQDHGFFTESFKDNFPFFFE